MAYIYQISIYRYRVVATCDKLIDHVQVTKLIAVLEHGETASERALDAPTNDGSTHWPY